MPAKRRIGMVALVFLLGVILGSVVGEMIGLRLPIESHVLQAFVTEGIKPLLDTVITFGAGFVFPWQPQNSTKIGQ